MLSRLLKQYFASIQSRKFSATDLINKEKTVMFKIYLDNCCYNRPFDDLSQVRVRDEAVAKMFIQSLIKYKSLILFS